MAGKHRDPRQTDVLGTARKASWNIVRTVIAMVILAAVIIGVILMLWYGSWGELTLDSAT